MLYTVTGIIVIVFACIIITLAIIADNEEDKEYNEQVRIMHLNKEQEKNQEDKVLRTPHIYTEDELEEVREWLLEREYFKDSNFKVIQQKKCWAAIFGAYVGVGIFAEWWCFWPVCAVWVLSATWYNPLFGAFGIGRLNEGGPMLAIVSLIICFFAVIGLFSIVAWLMFLGSDKEERDWYKQEIEKSEKMCEAALQEAEKPLKEEINVLYNQLGDSEVKYEKLKVEHTKLKSLYDETEQEVKKKLSVLQEEYKREKRLWALEKKELQYQIKLKQGLVDEVEESESPLGGLYS